MEWPEIGREAFEELSSSSARESRSWRTFAGLTWSPTWRAGWRPRCSAFWKEAPPAITVPSGRQVKLTYEPGRPPVLAVRLQEVSAGPKHRHWPGEGFPSCSIYWARTTARSRSRPTSRASGRQPTTRCARISAAVIPSTPGRGPTRGPGDLAGRDGNLFELDCFRRPEISVPRPWKGGQTPLPTSESVKPPRLPLGIR